MDFFIAGYIERAKDFKPFDIVMTSKQNLMPSIQTTKKIIADHFKTKPEKITLITISRLEYPAMKEQQGEIQ
jgi:hypothetical protein